MSLIRRTWPYGTQKNVKVMHASPRMIMCADQTEAYVLMRCGETTLPAVGSRVVIVFTPGGPTGGYWKLQRN